MKPVSKRNFFDENGLPIRKTFQVYQDAKDLLIEDLGKYCSYCEIACPPRAGLSVEHILAKQLIQFSHLINDWNNFLLSCTNCNSVKGVKVVDLAQIHLPHLNNTFLCFRILEGGLLKLNPHLPLSEIGKAQNLMSLLGLERRPGVDNYSANDDRWSNRMEVWNLAHKYLEKYISNNIQIEIICELAKAKGFFSVWMTIFDAFPAVKSELITVFKAERSCFDNSFIPINRNGLLI
jgi:hypothetical protein